MSLNAVDRPELLDIDVVVFGAPDPEAHRAQLLCGRLGVQAAVATYHGTRVDFDSAIRPDGVSFDLEHYDLCDPKQLEGLQVVTFETVLPPESGATQVKDCNHHGVKDYGYSVSAQDYERGSSIGQLARLLGVPLNELEATTAALDHCLGAAIGGELDIDAQCALELYLHDVTATHRSAGVTRDVVQTAFDKARKSLARFDEVVIGDQPVLDMRRVHLGPSISPERLVTMAALAHERVAGINLSVDGHATDPKNMVNGKVAPSTVKAFLGGWAQANGMDHPFGVPDRGFCGGVLTSARADASTASSMQHFAFAQV